MLPFDRTVSFWTNGFSCGFRGLLARDLLVEEIGVNDLEVDRIKPENVASKRSEKGLLHLAQTHFVSLFIP